jgi:RNA polymerase sigma factor (sigma-70 family)
MTKKDIRLARLRKYKGMIYKVCVDYYKALKVVDAPLEFEDLVQEGMVAFLEACESFNDTLGVSFSTHFYWQLKGKFTKLKSFYSASKRRPKILVKNL